MILVLRDTYHAGNETRLVSYFWVVMYAMHSTRERVL